jgi:nitrogen fixation protein NifU and related proteins
MINDLYREVLLQEARQPKNVGIMNEPDLIITEYNASCGDRITIFLALDKKGQTITDVLWEGTGCIISQASMSLLSKKLKGMPWVKVQAMTKAEMLKLLGLKEILPGRTKCLMLGLVALKKTIKERVAVKPQSSPEQKKAKISPKLKVKKLPKEK